ncbi:MAG: UbiA family prenyltransferase, partial [Longimicrobiales bacterium]
GLTAEAGLAAGMVFTFVFAREILKDIADHDGDSASRVTTVATRLGRTASLRIFTLAMLVFAGTAILPWILGIASVRYMAAMSLLGLLPALAVAISVHVRPSDGNLTTALRITKVAWYGGLAAMVLLR